MEEAMDEMVELKVMVPRTRVADFYRSLAEWLENSDLPSSQREEWSGQDVELARWLLPKLSPATLEFFRLLWQEPGRLAWTGRYCAQRGKKAPIRFDESAGYWIEPNVAAVLKKAATEVLPEEVNR
jgi:hypothetical protein